MLGAEGTARSGASASILRQWALLVLLGGFQCPPEAPGTPRPLAASSHSRRTPSAIPAAAFSSSAWSVPRARRGHRDLVLQGHSQALPPPRAAPHGWLPCFVQDFAGGFAETASTQHVFCRGVHSSGLPDSHSRATLTSQF